MHEALRELFVTVVAFGVGGPVLAFAAQRMDRGGYGSRKGVGYAYATLAIAYGSSFALALATSFLLRLVPDLGAVAPVFLMVGNVIIWYAVLTKRYRVEVVIAIGMTVLTSLVVWLSRLAVGRLLG